MDKVFHVHYILCFILAYSDNVEAYIIWVVSLSVHWYWARKSLSCYTFLMKMVVQKHNTQQWNEREDVGMFGFVPLSTYWFRGAHKNQWTVNIISFIHEDGCSKETVKIDSEREDAGSYMKVPLWTGNCPKQWLIVCVPYWLSTDIHTENRAPCTTNCPVTFWEFVIGSWSPHLTLHALMNCFKWVCS